MGHWYTKDAKACHWVEGKNGKMRDTTLRDARTKSLLPSVTEIINTLDKPALVNWKIKQVLLAALTLPHEDGEGADSYYYTRVMKDAFTESNNARDRGLVIHDCIELIWNFDDTGHVFNDIVSIADKACTAISEYCETASFITEQIVIGNGYGGKVDLHNDEFVIDYKTKEISDADWDKYQKYLEDLDSSDPKKKSSPPKLAYPEMCMQLAAYDAALGNLWKTTTIGKDKVSYSFRRLINVFVDRNIPGRVIIHEWSNEEAVLAFEKFELLVKYWQLSKDYFPNE